MIGYALERRHARRSASSIVASLLVVLALSGGPALANHSLYGRISAGAINGNGGVAASFTGSSADASRVFFTTTEQLVAGDTDGAADIYQRSGGNTTRISAGAINGNGPVGAIFNKASTDGSRVFFSTSEPLVAGDTDVQQDIYQRSSGNTTRISAGAINGNGALPAFFNGISTDGSRVFFSTNEKLVAADTDTASDIYQRSSGTTTRISAGAINGNNNAYGASFVGASANGSRVFFVTSEQLVAGDTDTQPDIYQRSSGTTTRVSVGAINGNGASAVQFLRASTDGTRVLFATNEPLVAGDTDAQVDIYQRSGGVTTRVSAGAINGNGAFPSLLVGASADSTRVFFLTNEQLVAGDTDAQGDIYQRFSGNTTRISAGAINGNGAIPSLFVGASADGTRVFFQTAEQLVGADTDFVNDIYQRSGGTTTRISAGQTNGNQPLGVSFVGATPDGTRVFFVTQEQLATSDGDANQDIYERHDGVTSQLSPGDGPFSAMFKFVSGNGSRVIFETQERVVADDKDLSMDVYGAYTAP